MNSQNVLVALNLHFSAKKWFGRISFIFSCHENPELNPAILTYIQCSLQSTGTKPLVVHDCSLDLNLIYMKASVG